MSSSSYNPNITLTSLSTQQGEINLVTNPIAQFDASNWTTSSATLTRSTTGVLSPVIPTGFTASSTTSTTSYVQTSLLNVPATLRNRKLKVQLYIQCADTATWKVDVLKSDGSTRYTLSTDSSGVSALPALTGTYTTTFDMDTDSGIYVRLTRYAGSGTSTLSFTNLIVGPGIQPQGAALEQWQSYTPVLTSTVNPTTTAASGRFRRVGSNVEVQIAFTVTAYGTGVYIFSLPTGLTIDYTSTSSIATDSSIGCGNGYYLTNAGATRSELVPGLSSTGVYTDKIIAYRYNGAALANTDFTGASSTIFLVATVPIAQWSGSGTVQLAQNDVEFASNNGSGGTAANTAYNTGMTYGPAGNNIVAVASVTGGYQVTSYKVTFQTPIQSSDVLQIEILSPGKTNWVPVSDTVFSPSIRGTGYRSGMIIDPIDATSVYVSFGNGGAYSNNATFDAAGAAWSTQTGYKWRVRKSSAGAAVGFGIVQPGVSSGLVSSSGVPGNTTGNAIATGYVGEKVSFDWLATAMPNAGVIVNAWSKSLGAGVWLVTGGVGISGGTAGVVASVDPYMVVSISSTSVTENTENRVAQTLAPANSAGVRGITTSQIFTLAASTTIYLTVRHGYSTKGDAVISQDYGGKPYAIRIA